jgi:hypothetical protein
MHPFNQGQTMPGMEFFQSMLKGSGVPSGFASWMAPTMDPAELEQKITDLKAVLQWLETNARLTQATIQALEVQRMTLSALKTMNVDLGGLAGRMTDAMQAGAEAMGAAAAQAAAPAQASAPAAAAEPEPEVAPEPPAAAAADSALPGVLDPMQWWNAVSQQFTQVAAQAIRDNPWPMPGGEAGQASAAPAPAAAGAAPRAPAARKPAAGKVAAAGTRKPSATPAPRKAAAKPPTR